MKNIAFTLSKLYLLMSYIAIIDIEKCKPDKCNKECMKKCPPQNFVTGINLFLKDMDITMRTGDFSRPRINKPGSQLDTKQKHEETYFI